MVAALRENLESTLSQLTPKLGDYQRTPARQTFLEERVIKLNRYDQFDIITDVHLKEMIWHFQVKERMGYELPEEGMKDQTEQWVVPFVRSWYEALMMAGTIVFINEKIGSLKYHFDISVPMIVRGDQWLVKCTMVPFDIGDLGKPRTFLRSYTLVARYQGEAVKVTVGGPDSEAGRVSQLQLAIDDCLLAHVPNNTLPLTKLQLRVMRAIRDLREDRPDGSGITNKKISEIVYADRESKVKDDKDAYRAIRLKDERAADKAMSSFKKRLLELMYDSNLAAQEKEFFLQESIPMMVIHWFEQSGLIPLMEAFMKKRSPTKV